MFISSRKNLWRGSRSKKMVRKLPKRKIRFITVKSMDPSILNDSIVIHGMHTSGKSMRRFCSALTKRNCYRYICNFSVFDFRHRLVPKIKERKIARDIVAPEIIRLVESNRIAKEFDLIGHSNGGYVAIHLSEFLPKGYIRNIFTMATPKGFYNLTPNYYNVNKVVLFVAGMDEYATALKKLFPTENDMVTRNALLFRFPDESHCSIHQNADSNGVAEVISYFLGSKKSSHCFVDFNRTLHIHSWCRRECKELTKEMPVSMIKRTKIFTVCDGVHYGDQIEYIPNEHQASFWSSIISDIRNLRNRVKRLDEIRDYVKVEWSNAKFEKKATKKEITFLKEQNKRLLELREDMESKIEERISKITKKLMEKRIKISDYLSLAEAISSGKVLHGEELKQIVDLMAIASSEYSQFISLANGSKRLMLPYG